MVWKILGFVVVAWLALMVLGWLLNKLLTVLVIGAILFGVYALYRAAKGKSRNPVG